MSVYMYETVDGEMVTIIACPPPLPCDHLWVAGGLASDWVCEHCGKRTNIGDDEDDH